MWLSGASQREPETRLCGEMRLFLWRHVGQFMALNVPLYPKGNRFANEWTEESSFHGRFWINYIQRGSKNWRKRISSTIFPRYFEEIWKINSARNKLQRLPKKKKKENEFYVNFNNKFKYINFKYTSIWLGWYRRLRLTMKQCNQQSVDDTRLLLGDRPGYAFHYVLEFMCSIRIIHPILRHDWNKMG